MLRRAGLGVVGAGSDLSFKPGVQIWEASVGGARVAALGACLLDEKYAFDGGLSPMELPDAVRQVAVRSDLVIVSLHWGTEYMDRPQAAQRQLARALVDAGARLVLGHHPHVVQGVETYHDAVIAYSLGNFVFDQLPPDTRWSVILSIDADAHGVSRWEAIRVLLDERHRPVPCQGYCAGPTVG